MVSTEDLAGLPLLAGLPEAELAQVASFMTRMEAPAGTRLFSEGEQDERLCVIDEGRVKATIRLPQGGERTVAELGKGDTMGEIALLAGGRRAATITTLARTSGWLIDAQAFEMLRLDPRPGAITLLRRLGDLALSRLRSKYDWVASELGGQPEELDEPVSPGEPAPQGLLALEYLASLICFARFERPAYVEEVIRSVPTRAMARGDLVLREHASPDALLLVARGAIEVTIRHTAAARRVRLAGPGRFIGHAGVLDDGPRPVVARARERSVLFEFPRSRIAELLDDPSPAGRRFASAVYEDVARAVREAERPLATTVIAGGARRPLQSTS